MTNKNRIRDIGKRLLRIKDTGKTQPRIDPKEVAKALGAELITDRKGRPGHKP